MHLLSAQAGAIQQDGEAIDLAQTPGQNIFASSAASALAMLPGAVHRPAETEPRLAHTLRLPHQPPAHPW